MYVRKQETSGSMIASFLNPVFVSITFQKLRGLSFRAKQGMPETSNK